FLDNLFSSVRLFRALRKLQVGASGTYRVDSGINRKLAAEKDTKGQGILWGKIHCIPTSDREVITKEQVIWAWRRPAGDTAVKRAARKVFGANVRKDLPVSILIN
ncbi:hypothetical protein CI238_13204, partial [Colletotrichum incanum]